MLYLIPGSVKFLGYESRLPKDHKPVLTYEVLDYEKKTQQKPTEVGKVTKLAMNTKLDKGIRLVINKELRRVGMDGNGRFAKPGIAYAKAWEVLERFGYFFPHVQNSFAFNPDQGTLNVEIAMGTGDIPLHITNSMFTMQWTKPGDYSFEVVAYLS